MSLPSPAILLIALLISLAPHSSAAEPELRKRPNIIVIFTDDQGYNDLGCYGSPQIKTPHLDRMAQDGLRLTSFYAQPVCGVSRAALMIGCYPIRIAEPGNLKRLHTVPHPREITVAELLKEAGYATACIGKWHLGDTQATMPNAQGFEYFYGTPIYNGFTVKVEDAPFRSTILRNEEIVTREVKNWDGITASYTAEAIRWIEEKRDRPFFLYLAHNMPHIPLGASERFRNKSAAGPYGDAIEEIDWSCGEIFAALKRLNLDESTLVIFTSDNGPWIEPTQTKGSEVVPFIPRNHSGNAAPLRGAKMTGWEGGSRVPCLVRWPGKVKAGRVSDALTSTMDFLPTLATLAGAKLPENITLDGRDLSKFLLGESEQSPREEFFYYAGCRLLAVRDARWKLVLPRPAKPANLLWWGRMIDAVDTIQLYDLAEDMGETKNVAAAHPEICVALMKRIQRARTELGDIDQTGTGARLFDKGPRKLPKH